MPDDLYPFEDRWLEIDGHRVEGFWRAHQVPLAEVKSNPKHLKLLEEWMHSYEPRELFMIVLARIALSRGVDLKINWLGRWGVWPVFGSLFFAMCGVHWLALACLYVGLALTLGATVLYVRDGLKQASGQASTSA